MYIKETMLGDPGRGKRFCFKPSSTYTAECQDTGDGSIAIDSSIVIDSSEMKPGSSKSPDSPKSLD